MIRLVLLLATVACLAAAGSAAAQAWQARPEDPAWRAERLRIEHEGWRAGLELRALQAEADQRRTEAAIARLRAQRGPALAPPPAGEVYLGPVDPALVAPDPAGAADRRETLERGLSGLDAWLDRARPD